MKPNVSTECVQIVLNRFMIHCMDIAHTNESPLAFCVYRDFNESDSGPLKFNRHYLAYSARGIMRLKVDQRIWSLQPMRAAWVPANTQVEVQIPNSITCCSVLYDANQLIALNTDVCIVDLSALSREMILHCRQWGPDVHAHNGKVEQFFTVLATVLAEQMEKPSNDWVPCGHSPLIAAAITLTSEQYAEPLDIGQIALQLNVSDRTLSRRVCEETGMTWSHLLRRIRIVHARELLTSGSSSITTTAAEVGYLSQSAFNRAFREESAMTPSEFQALHR